MSMSRAQRNEIDHTHPAVTETLRTELMLPGAALILNVDLNFKFGRKLRRVAGAAVYRG